MRRTRITALALALAAATTSAGAPALGAQVRQPVATTLTLAGPADRMLNGVLQLGRGEVVTVRGTLTTGFELDVVPVWYSADTTVVLVMPGAGAVGGSRGVWSYTWDAAVRGMTVGDTAISLRAGSWMAVLPVRVTASTMTAPRVGTTIRAPIVRDRSTTLAVATAAAPATATVTPAPEPPGAAPTAFTAQYVGAGKVEFTWQPVAGAAGVAVYDARAGAQVSPLVPGTSWVSGALAPGSYTFVAAPWRAVVPGAAPTVTAERSAPVVVTIPPY